VVDTGPAQHGEGEGYARNDFYHIDETVRFEMAGKAGFYVRFYSDELDNAVRECTTLESAREYVRIQQWRLQRMGISEARYIITDKLTCDQHSLDLDWSYTPRNLTYPERFVNYKDKPLPELEIDGMLKYGVIVAKRPVIHASDV